MNWLLIFVSISIGLKFLAPEQYFLLFVTFALAILPLAGWMGRATEQLAERMGEGVEGLLNATFGNAAELMIALAALRAGLHNVVKASIAGSIVGNILLVLGAAMLAGGLRRSEQRFDAAGAVLKPRCSCSWQSGWSCLPLFKPRRGGDVLSRLSSNSVSRSPLY